MATQASPGKHAVEAESLSTTEDALGRPRTLRPGEVTTAFGEIACRRRDEPIYDTDWWTRGDSQVRFFQNFHSYCGNVPPDEHGNTPSKRYQLDTNLSGASSSLPAGHSHEVTGVSVVLLAHDRSPLAPVNQEILAEHASLQLVLCQCPILTIPLADCLLKPRHYHDEETDIQVADRPAPPVFPLPAGIMLRAMEQFDVRILFPDGPIMTIAALGGGANSPVGGCFVRVELAGVTYVPSFAGSGMSDYYPYGNRGSLAKNSSAAQETF